MRTPSDEERDRAIATLERHYAGGHLDVATFEQRVEAVLHAPSLAMIEALVADLPVLPTSALIAPVQAPWVLSSTLSTLQRTGDFAVTGPLLARARFGSIEIDLRNADLQWGYLHIDVQVFCGSVRIDLPVGARALVDCRAMLGSVEVQGESTFTPGAPVIHVGGRVVLGSLEVVLRPSPSSARGTATKALPAAAPRLLPR
jgi:hypothetical protein